MEEKSERAAVHPPVASDFPAPAVEPNRWVGSIRWESTELGPVSGWPSSLRNSAGICMGSTLPMLILWGERRLMIYNEAFRPVLGDRHPAYGRPVEAVFPQSEDFSNTRVGESYYSFCRCPILSERDGERGFLLIASDTTDRVLMERRLGTLRKLAVALRDSESVSQVCQTALHILEGDGSNISRASIRLVVSGARFESCREENPFSTSTSQAVVLPLKPIPGSLTIAINPRHRFDEAYRTFFEIISDLVSSALSRALEHEILDQALQATGTAMVRWERDSDRLEWHGDARRILGTDPVKSLAQFATTIHRDEQAQFRAFLQSSETQASFRFHTGNGSLRSLTVSKKVHVGGNTTFVVGNGIETLRTSERIQSILQAAPVPMILHDLSGEIFEVNRSFTELTGYTREDVPNGREWFRRGRRIAPESVDALLDSTHKRIAEDGPASREVTIWTKSGERREWLFHSSGPIADDSGNSFVVSAATDVTERKRMEEALRESERRLRRLVDSNTVGIVFCGQEIITDANDVFLEMVGYTREELRTGQINWREMTPAEFRQADDEAVRESLARGAAAPFEKEFLRKDGIRVPVLVGPALVNPEPEWVCFVLDLTRQKQAERFLQQSNEDLQRFAYAASHDLQEPLRMIASYTELLARRNHGKLDDSSQEYLGFVQQAIGRMKTLIQDLLEYSRLTHGCDENAGPTDSGCMFDLALMHLQPVIKESGAVVTCDDLPVVQATDARLLQVFQNLIGNAIKYRSKAPPRIHVHAEIEEGVCTFSISDNGIGIAPQYHERIFGVFQRLHPRSEYEGTGIGLAIVKRVVERLGGRIWVGSELGRGATFYFTLPLA